MPPGAEYAWAAFQRLHRSDRPYSVSSYALPAGMGAVSVIEPRPGRIPFAALDRYARRYGVEGNAFEAMLAIIDALDDCFLGWEADRARERAQAAAARS